MPATKRSWKEQWQRRCRYLYLKFIRLRGHPKELARGLAAGVFAGMFPLFGLQTLIGVAVAFRIKGNPLMAAAGTWISNPFTYLPIFAFNYQIGAWVLQRSDSQPFTDAESLQSWVETGTDVAVTLLLGSFIVGLIAGTLSYFIGLPLIRRTKQGYRQFQRGPAEDA
ncbi:MAG: DUF2062 domain-containing protein [Cyanobacteria bacterium J06638_28]